MSEPAADSIKRPPILWAFLAPFVALILAVPIAFLGFGASGITFVGGADRAAMLRGLLTKPAAFLIIFAALPVALMVTALVAARRSRVPWRRRLRLQPGILRLRDYPVLVLGDIGAVALSICMVAGMTALGWLPPVGKEYGDIVGMLRHVPVELRWLVLVALSLLPGLGEELMFRGYVQTRLVERFRPALGVGLASLFFSLFHGDLSYAAFVLPGALYLGYIAWRSGSIYPSILCHVSSNALVQTLQMTVGKSLTGKPETAPTTMEAIGIALAIVLSAIAALLAVRYLETLHRRRAAPPDPKVLGGGLADAEVRVEGATLR